MIDVPLERRVTSLEDLVAEAWHVITESGRQIAQLSAEMRDFKDEMRDFKDEMRDFKDEMRYFKDEMRDFKDEMRDFKDEMRDFKDEMGDFKDEMGDFKDEMRDFKDESQAWRKQSEAEIRKMRKQWGELSNRLGTMAEDLVAPSVSRILRQTVGCPGDRVESVAVRVRRLHPADPGREQEFDVVAVCGEHVLINETKSRLDPQVVLDFAQRLPEAREFFPEYADKYFIGAIASLYVDESIVRYGEKLGLIVLGFGEDVMDILNSPGFSPKRF